MIDVTRKPNLIEAGANTNTLTVRQPRPVINAAIGRASVESGTMSDAVEYDFLQWVSGENVQWTDLTSVILKAR